MILNLPWLLGPSMVARTLHNHTPGGSEGQLVYCLGTRDPRWLQWLMSHCFVIACLCTLFG